MTFTEMHESQSAARQGPIHVRFNDSIGPFRLDAAFQAPAQGVTALFGPSGCGKTTVLRCIAGLHRPAAGYCEIGGDIWQDDRCFRPPHEREIGYVFQEPSLFPHLSVRGNLAFGVRDKRRGQFDDAVDLLGLKLLLDRSPRNLSGGERQRVAIGRALFSRPKLLLMDEPLSALDRSAKEDIVPFLERLHNALALPIVYVTHDMHEVERLADHLVMMDGGRVIAVGAIGALQSDPRLPLIASREAAVSLDAALDSYDTVYGAASFSVAGGVFRAPSPNMPRGSKQRLRIYASDVSLARERPSQSTIDNILPGRILSANETGGGQITAVIGLGEAGAGARVLARVTKRSWDILQLAPGLPVYAQVKAVALVR